MLILSIPLLASFAGGCAIGTKFDEWPGMEPTDKLVVLPFQDHASEDPRDSKNTGRICQDIFVKAFLRYQTAEIVDHVLEGHDPTTAIGRSAATEIGRQLEADYVMTGRCTEFYRVAPMTFRADQGAVDVEVMRVEDGKRVYHASAHQQCANFGEPEDCIEAIAGSVASELRAPKK